MKRRLGFLVLLFTLIFLSGCELLQQITYQDIGDQNVVMKIRMQYYVSNQIDLDETVNAYINNEDSWIAFHAVNENFYLFLIENDDNTISVYDIREDKIFEEFTVTGDLKNSEDLKEFISPGLDIFNMTKVIDELNGMTNDDELDLESIESNDESLKDYELFVATLKFNDLSSDIINILYSPDDREENISMEDYEQKVTLGFDGKQIKYFSYNQKELNRGDDTYPLLTYHYAYSFYIESVGRETKEKFNDIEDLEIFPKK